MSGGTSFSTGKNLREIANKAFPDAKKMSFLSGLKMPVSKIPKKPAMNYGCKPLRKLPETAIFN
jgi:hypothetical protein